LADALSIAMCEGLLASAYLGDGRLDEARALTAALAPRLGGAVLPLAPCLHAYLAAAEVALACCLRAPDDQGARDAARSASPARPRCGSRRRWRRASAAGGRRPRWPGAGCIKRKPSASPPSSGARSKLWISFCGTRDGEELASSCASHPDRCPRRGNGCARVCVAARQVGSRALRRDRIPARLAPGRQGGVRAKPRAGQGAAHRGARPAHLDGLLRQRLPRPQELLRRPGGLRAMG